MNTNAVEENEKRRRQSRQLGPSLSKKKKFVEFIGMRLKYLMPKSVRSPRAAGIPTPVPVSRRIEM